MPTNDPNNDNARLRRLLAGVSQGADMASELAHRLDDGEEGEGTPDYQRASDISAHLLGCLLEWDEGEGAESDEQSGAPEQEPRQGLGAVNGSDPLESERRAESAMVAAGEAMDAAMMQLTTEDSIHILRDPQLVNKLHQGLNRLVAIVGCPWRRSETGADGSAEKEPNGDMSDGGERAKPER